MEITVESRHDIENILAVLSEAEENGGIDFSFGCHVEQMKELDER